MKIIEAKRTERACDIIQRAGVETIHTGKQADGTNGIFWKYGDKIVGRPPVNNWEKEMFKHFDIKIKYVK
jgi:hypothetical protein